ncbi:hypothetical protein [Pelosinus sp. UFO1]|uniref:hypothetical protein n=1 Tax=Pelosinus sp. UFO1 TaxID=484770 RepID=UPI0004D13E74|nr:hypothetical protein [Pelosinus sp. UFO1]AIF51326.1 hypothetical protein UFO1_1775 [Pelosinus sp. UFO1]
MINNQRGSVIVMGLVFMIFMGIIVSGLTFATETNVKLMTKNKNALEAQYAAESGAVRAKSGILSGSSDWSWLNTSISVATDENKTYNVTIIPTIQDNASAEQNKTYTIISTGIVNGLRKAVTIKVSKSLFPYAVYNGGNKLTVNQGFHIIYNGQIDQEGMLSTQANINQINNNAHFPLIYKSMEIPKMPVDTNNGSYNKFPSLLTPLKSTLNLTKGTYYMPDGINNNGNSIIASGGGDVVIFAHGGGNLGGNSSTNPALLKTDATTTLTLITDQGFNINSNVNLIGNIKIFSHQGIQINSGTGTPPPTNYVQIMSDQDITINSNVVLNKAVVIAGQDLSINSGVVITGCIIAGRFLTLNGGTIYYDPNVLSNWGQ